MCLNLDVYFCCPAGYCRRIWGAEGVSDGRLLSPRAFDRDIFTYISLWPNLRPWLTGIQPQVVMERPGDHHMTSIEFFSYWI